MIEILFEDNNLVFCVKPAGVSSEDEFPAMLKNELNCEIYTLHRLDKPVGGVMVYAKNKKTAAEINKKISEQSDFSKTYLTVCEGEFIEEAGVMDDLLFKDSQKNKSFVVKRERKGVRRAILCYRVLEKAEFQGKICSLVSVSLKTGRSHQIRVQFASRKHPLCGDRKYGSKYNCPIALFSHEIKTGEYDFKKNPPEQIPWNLFKLKGER